MPSTRSLRLLERGGHRRQRHRHAVSAAQLGRDVHQGGEAGGSARRVGRGRVVHQPPQVLVPARRRHARRIAVEPLEALEGVADQGRVRGHPGQRDLRPRGRVGQQVRQRHGVEAADHDEHRSLAGAAPRKRLADVPHHLGLPGRGAVTVELGPGVVLARELAVCRDACQVLRGTDPAQVRLEQVLPEVLLVAAPQLLGKRLEALAVLEVVLGQQGLPGSGTLLVGARCRLRLHGHQALLGEVEVDEAGRDPAGCRLLEGHQLGGVVAEGVVGAPALVLVAAARAHGIRIDRQRHVRLRVGEQRDVRGEAPRALDEDHRRAVLLEGLADVPGAGRAVVAHRHHDELVAGQRRGELAHPGGGQHGGVAVLSGRARGGRRAPAATAGRHEPVRGPRHRSSDAASCRRLGCPSGRCR